MDQQSLSILSYSRSHQGLGTHPQEVSSSGLSKKIGEITNLSPTSFWHKVENNRQPTPIILALFAEILDEPQKVCELLAENVELIQNLPNELRRLATKSALTLTKDRSFTLACVLLDFGAFIWKLPHGQKAQNREVAIACCETALNLLESQKFSQVWGQIHNNLALAYAERLMGDRTANLSQAFTHYQKAAQVVGRQPFPKHWIAIHT